MLPPERRLGRILELIDKKKYFVLRAGRQTGKTTSARWLVRHFNQGDRYRCTWIDVQTAADQPDPARAFRTVLNCMKAAVQVELPGYPLPDTEALLKDPATAIQEYLQQVSAASPLPLIVLFDEADCLVGEAMVLFLKQIRAGYLRRDEVRYPHSLALIGMREVRDFALSQEERRAVSWLGSSSPFNITAEAATLQPFTEPEVAELLGQHTARRDTMTGVEALEQLVGYLEEAGLEEGWLVLFDLRKEIPWSEKLTLEEVRIEGKRIWVVGC